MNMVRRMDRRRFDPEIVCLKEPGPLGELLAAEMPVHSQLIGQKYDLGVLPRLRRLMRQRKVGAVVTVAAGDNMFWGRLAARLAGTPVVASALHSTGWPDGVGRLNRMLTRWTDAFIAVADAHAEFLIQHERFPRQKVHTIYNGVDVDRFVPGTAAALRSELGVKAGSPLVGIVAALRPEKNHELFLDGARQILNRRPETRFVIVGDGPRRELLEQRSKQLRLSDAVFFLGNRDDVPKVLAALDVFALTSHNEASPVSILEALSCECPVAAPDVGSISETVAPGETGILFPVGDLEAYVEALDLLLGDPASRAQMGQAGRRRVIEQWSLEGMTRGYESLIEKHYNEATARRRRGSLPGRSLERAGQPSQ